jgi:hypothetical protein
MTIGNLKIDLKTKNPFKLGQYILRLIDLIKALQKDIKAKEKEIIVKDKENIQLRKELEEVKKNFS